MPHAFALMIFGLVGRLELPAVSIVMTFLVVDWTGSYFIGGVLGAAMLIGQAVAGPLRGRAADRHSRPRLLLVTATVHGLGLALLALLARPEVLPASMWWLLTPLVLVTGLSQPPVSALARSVWPEVAQGSACTAAYAVEATLQELLFVVAPVLAATTVALAGPVVAMLCCAVLAIAGPAAFALVLVRAGVSRLKGGHSGAEKAGTRASLLGVRGVRTMLGFAALIAIGMVTIDLVIVNWSRGLGRPELVGWLTAMSAIGSLGGGLLMGARTGPARLWLRGGLAGAGMLALIPVLPPLTDSGSPWVVGAILFLGGAAIAPTMSTCNSMMAGLVPPRRRSEAFGWLTTSVLAGSTIASPLAGALLDHTGPGVALGMAGGLALLGALLVRKLREDSPVTEPALAEATVS